MPKINPPQSIIQQMGKGKQFPALSLIRRDTETATLISKLVKPRNEEKLVNPNEYKNKNVGVDSSSLARISETIRQNIKDNDNILSLFPDIELGMQILISSIISPKDMVTNELSYAIKSNILPPEVATAFIEKIKEHFEGYYKFDTLLPTILREALFESGACVFVVIPESSVDELINRRSYASESTGFFKEQLGKLRSSTTLGYLGSPNPNDKRVTAFESLFSTDFNSNVVSDITEINSEGEIEVSKHLKGLVQVSDNVDHVKLPFILEKRREWLISDKMGSRKKRREALEAIYANEPSLSNVKLPRKEEQQIVKRLNENELEKTIFKPSQNETVPFINVKTNDLTHRRSIGRPLFYKMPTSAVIPVITPGDEKKHVGYFILHDEEGYPINHNISEADLTTLEGMLNNPNQGMTSHLLQRARRQMDSISCDDLTLDKATQLYSDIVNADLLRRLKNGVYGSNVKIAAVNDIYRIMLARTYKNQYTRLVFIPAELVSYYTFRYYDSGVGKSLLDDMKFILSLRAILLVSRTIGSIKNSIGVTEIRMKLDDRDPDPWGTIEVAVDEILKTRAQWLPAGLNRPSDVVYWAQRAGFEFSFEGHRKIPEMNMEFNQKANGNTMPDTDLEDNLRKQSIQGLGLSPENVDNGFSSDFATTIVNNNLLLSKRVQLYQTTLMPMLERQLRILVENDQLFYKELVEVLLKNKDSIQRALTDGEKEDFKEDFLGFLEVFIDDIISEVKISLPTPNYANLVNQMVALDDYIEALDKGLDVWMSSEFITQEFANNASSYIDEARAAVRSYYIRKYMADNNILPELSDLTLLDTNGKPALDIWAIHNEHVQSVVQSMIGYLSKTKPFAKAADKDIENMGLDGESDYTPSESSTSSSSDDDAGGGDDFGLGDDAFGSTTDDNETKDQEEGSDTTSEDNFGLNDDAFK